jgi:hypothetical protein
MFILLPISLPLKPAARGGRISLHPAKLRSERRANRKTACKYGLSASPIPACKWYLGPMGWCAHHATRHNTPIHNIISTVAQLSISQKALGTLPEDGYVMPKHVEATIPN